MRETERDRGGGEEGKVEKNRETEKERARGRVRERGIQGASAPGNIFQTNECVRPLDIIYNKAI